MALHSCIYLMCCTVTDNISCFRLPPNSSGNCNCVRRQQVKSVPVLVYFLSGLISNLWDLLQLSL